jgi:hypothetical protein
MPSVMSASVSLWAHRNQRAVMPSVMSASVSLREHRNQRAVMPSVMTASVSLWAHRNQHAVMPSVISACQPLGIQESVCRLSCRPQSASGNTGISAPSCRLSSRRPVACHHNCHSLLQAPSTHSSTSKRSCNYMYPQTVDPFDMVLPTNNDRLSKQCAHCYYRRASDDWVSRECGITRSKPSECPEVPQDRTLDRTRAAGCAAGVMTSSGYRNFALTRLNTRDPMTTGPHEGARFHGIQGLGCGYSRDVLSDDRLINGSERCERSLGPQHDHNSSTSFSVRLLKRAMVVQTPL